MPIDTVEGQRKLAAILAADVAGYSRLMADDERATVAALKAAREVFRKHVEAHAGRLIDTTGDSVLAEFRSPVEAVECAVEIQRQLKTVNAPVPDHRKMFFRIGVNLGDVIEEADGTIYGDGVNVAARLEGLAEPGGIMLADVARQTVEGKLDVGLADAGEHEVKNIAKPVRAWRVLLDGEGADRAKMRAGIHTSWALVAMIITIIVVAGISFWQFGGPANQPETADVTTDQILAMPIGPSIAVLPFDNMSDEPEQEYFADGLTEDIITALSRFGELGVAARNSTFQFKGQAIDVRQVSEHLGVEYVLEGSVRRSEDMLRVTAQLLDGVSGEHLWANAFERDLTAEAVFAIQDAITSEVVNAIAGTHGVIARADLRTAMRKPPESLHSYECVLLAHDYERNGGDDTIARASECLEKAVEDDPGYDDGWAWLSYVLNEKLLHYSGGKPSPELADQVEAAAKQALDLNPSNQRARLVLALHYFWRRDLDRFAAEAERAIAVNSNRSDVLAEIAWRVGCGGDWERGVALMNKAIALNPEPLGWYYGYLSWDAYRRHDYQAALSFASQAEIPGFFWSYVHLAIANAQLGRPEEAYDAIEKLLDLYPDFSADAKDQIDVWAWAEPGFAAHAMEGLEKAGLFDEPDAPSRPIIAVLPFDNMSGDPEQEYFADGITEDIITRMSEFQDLGVIARNSTFQYKGQAVDVRAVADALGADYVLEGSI
jgi:adenylate cyclase